MRPCERDTLQESDSVENAKIAAERATAGVNLSRSRVRSRRRGTAAARKPYRGTDPGAVMNGTYRQAARKETKGRPTRKFLLVSPMVSTNVC